MACWIRISNSFKSRLRHWRLRKRCAASWIRPRRITIHPKAAVIREKRSCETTKEWVTIVMERILRALVIDDEKPVRDFVCTVLNGDGWEVTTASSGEEAFELLKQQNWSIVICDVRLGGADGYAVLRRFKEALPETRVVLMTGHGHAAGALDATAFGAYDYLLKPFSVENLQSLSLELREQLVGKPRQISALRAYDGDIDLVGRSHAFIDVMKQVGRVAATRSE